MIKWIAIVTKESRKLEQRQQEMKQNKLKLCRKSLIRSLIH